MMKPTVLFLTSFFAFSEFSQLYGQSLADIAKQQRAKLCKAGHTQFCDKGQKPDPDTTAKGSLGPKEGFVLESQKPDKAWMGSALTYQDHEAQATAPTEHCIIYLQRKQFRLLPESAD